MSAPDPAAGKTAASEAAASEPVADGDLLIPNHSFESGLTGWTVQSGRHGDDAGPACEGTVTVVSQFPKSGTASARLTPARACVMPALASAPVDVRAGTTYTAFATVRAAHGGAAIGLRYLDSAGGTVGEVWSARASANEQPATMRADAKAPAAAKSARIVVATTGETFVDDVLVSARFTDLGNQVKVNATANGTAYSTDGHGRDTAYTTLTGGHGFDAHLVGIDLVTTEVTLDIPIPKAMGAWNATSTPDGTVYIGAYNYADPGVNGHLYSYTPGADQVVDLGEPVPGDGFLYGVTGAPDGSVYGGSFPSGGVWKYTPGKGYTQIGPRPILPGIQYVRSIGYDQTTGIVYAGTGGSSHIVACRADGVGDCVELLPSSYAKYPWVYNLTADDGHAFARVTDDHGDDHLVVLKASVGADGAIHGEVVTDIPGLSFPGVSNAVDGKVYYAKSGALFSYDIASGTETDLKANTGIWARQWTVLHLADQDAYPGDTLVGTNSSGYVARYNIPTGKLTITQVAALPKAVADIETIVGGPDGKIYNAGYLVGGLGVYSPMRQDQQILVPNSAGYGQAEGMTVLGDRIYQGVYPGAFIKSFDPATAAAGKGPRTDCELHEEQDRPYGMLGAYGKVWAGTMAIYGRNAGALSVFDPADGSCTVYKNVVPEQSLVSLTASRGLIFGGSLVWGGLGADPTQAEAKLLVFDPATEKATTYDLPVRGIRAITGLTTAPDGKVWLLAQNHIFQFDPDSRTFARGRNAFPDLTYDPNTRITAYDGTLITAKDGYIYGAIRQKYFFRLDPRSGAVTVLSSSIEAFNLAEDGYGNIYLIRHANRLLRYVPEPRQ
ncbi:hypothetical protein [Actinopolymorpha cephalotaxi]|uniref:Carbohydrate binding domain-containing protein n=1 Tax=Actinopolymorpha cephalotaxi TaxID=504797 RepID=A0ABX2S7A2_9ACTN|nr:hypothetical protein [Actinopolymorpha cephalotaxi]NYH84315.1 hypothetical protein [Actinopolymorpha cephalotaxi]